MEMRQRVFGFVLSVVVCIGLMGCAQDVEEPSPQVIAEGVIHHVHYEIGDGKTGGLTRVNSPDAVPGKNGSWNVNAYGKLYRDYLVITKPDGKDLGSRVIPRHRLLSVQFGDGGIKQVAEKSSLD